MGAAPRPPKLGDVANPPPDVHPAAGCGVTKTWPPEVLLCATPPCWKPAPEYVPAPGAVNELPVCAVEYMLRELTPRELSPVTDEPPVPRDPPPVGAVISVMPE